MSRNLKWLLSASLAFGSAAFLIGPNAQAAENAGSSNATGNTQQNDQMSSEQSGPQLPEGTQPSNQQVKVTDLTSPIADATNAAMQKNGLSNMVGDFDSQDQSRLNDISNLQSKKLNGRIAQLQKAWKDKYNQSFSVKPEDFSSAQFAEGKIENPQQFAQNWPMSLVSTSGAQQAAAHSSANSEQNGNQSIKQGDQVAVVRLPAENGMPAMDVSLVNQSGWKIEIPNDRTARQIHDDVLTQLTMVGENTDKLPSDVKQANALVARHVLAGIYGAELPQNGQSQSGQTQSQSQNQQSHGSQSQNQRSQ